MRRTPREIDDMLYPFIERPYVDLLGKDDTDYHLLNIIGFLSILLGEGRFSYAVTPGVPII